MITAVTDRGVRRHVVWLTSLAAAALIVVAVLAGLGITVIVGSSLLAGAAATVGVGRRAVAAWQTEVARLSDLVDRRAEQVAALSHELRTPLTMIKGSADLLLEGKPGATRPRRRSASSL